MTLDDPSWFPCALLVTAALLALIDLVASLRELRRARRAERLAAARWDRAELARLQAIWRAAGKSRRRAPP